MVDDHELAARLVLIKVLREISLTRSTMTLLVSPRVTALTSRSQSSCCVVVKEARGAAWSVEQGGGLMGGYFPSRLMESESGSTKT